jgi:hypothetical protein
MSREKALKRKRRNWTRRHNSFHTRRLQGAALKPKYHSWSCHILLFYSNMACREKEKQAARVDLFGFRAWTRVCLACIIAGEIFDRFRVAIAIMEVGSPSALIFRSACLSSGPGDFGINAVS